MTENFSHEEIEDVIQFNKDIVEERGQPFSVNHERLSKVFTNVNSFNNMPSKKERIIRKASHIFGGIAWQQPFSEGNKETALALTKLFLRRNGFDLPIITRNDNKEIFDLLVKTVFKDELDPTITTEVEEFLLEKVVEY